METKENLQIGKLITFLAITLFLNYILGNIFDLKIISYFSAKFQHFFENDKILLKLILSLFYWLYVFIYIFFITWMLKRIFLVNKQFILIHINIVLLFLLWSSISWVKDINIYIPSSLIVSLPIISVCALVIIWLFKWKLTFIDNNIDNDISLMDSFKNDIKQWTEEVWWFFSKLRNDFKNRNNIEDERYVNKQTDISKKIINNESENNENLIWNNFKDRFNNNSNNSEEEDFYIQDIKNRSNVDEEDLIPKNIKWILKENKNRYLETDTDNQNDPDTNSNQNKKFSILDKISINNFNNDNNNNNNNNYLPNDNWNEDDYIEIKEIEEDDIMDDEFIDNRQDNNFWDWIEKNNNNHYVDNWLSEDDNQDKNNEEDNFDKDDYYVVWFSTNNELNLLNDLIKKL